MFESRDRVGGRLFSRPGPGGRLDVGAPWFWPGEDRVARLVAELDIRAHPQYLTGDALYHSRPVSRRIDGNPLDMPSTRFTDGADSLAESLAALLPGGALRLGQAVRSLTQVVGGVALRAPHGGVVGRHVVLALPPALATARLAFEPALPGRVAELAAVTPVWMGATTKVVARYSEPFWRHDGLSGSAFSDVGPLREVREIGPVTIMFWRRPDLAGSALRAIGALRRAGFSRP